MRKYILLFVLVITLSVYSQKESRNIQSYTPSVLIEKGHWEYKMFNNLYTQTKGFGDDGKIADFNARSSYFSSINHFLFGISNSLNIGIDIWVKSVSNDSENKSALNALRFENSLTRRIAFTGIGPKIKIAPIRSLEKLSLQSTFLFPVAKNLEGVSGESPYLSEDSYIWYTQIYYDQPLGEKFQLFFQFAPWLNIKRKKPENDVSRYSYANPVSLFVSYFATPRFTLYLQNEYWPSFGSNGVDSWFLQEGLGVKYQLVPGLIEVEALYTKFLLGKNSGAGNTFNIGIRIIR